MVFKEMEDKFPGLLASGTTSGTQFHTCQICPFSLSKDNTISTNNNVCRSAQQGDCLASARENGVVPEMVSPKS